jgi:TetR/AcrR family tetracycline transcriptional repressor
VLGELISVRAGGGRSATGPGDPEEHHSGERYSNPVNTVYTTVNTVHGQCGQDGGSVAEPPGPDADALWFSPPGTGERGRRTLTRERVVAEALVVISTEGAQALSMRALAGRLGVVPGALYRHVRSKEQLYDLVLDAVLAEAVAQPGPARPDPGQADPGRPEPAKLWTAQIAALAHRLRAVLENHPGIAALLKTRDPLSPASLALAEGFLAPLLAAGLPGNQAALAFRLIYDYTLGFALADPSSPAEQRLRDTATRRQLHAFLRRLPPGRFPSLAACGAHAWDGDRDQRFTAGLDTLLRGLQTTRRTAGPEPDRAAGRPAEGAQRS